MGVVDGKRIVVTGASRGLGRAFAHALAGEGARLVVNGTNASLLDDLVADVRASGGEAVAAPGSVADDAVAEAMVAACVESFGGIDAVVNNAGIVRDRTLMNMTPEEFDEVVAVNLRGTWSVSRHAARAMRESGGLLLQVVSNAAFVGSVGQTNYAASKAGVMGMLYSWDVELRRFGIRTNALWPIAQTDMTQVVFDNAARRAADAGNPPPAPHELGFGSPEAVAPCRGLPVQRSCRAPAESARHLQWLEARALVAPARDGDRPARGLDGRRARACARGGRRARARGAVLTRVAADPMPEAEVAVDVVLVRALLEDQHPDLAAFEVSEPLFGWDNVMFRLGKELLVRLPRRAQAAALIEHEQRWLPVLAPALPLPIPAPVRVGRGACGFPWSWSVCPWLPGARAATHPPADMSDAARALGEFLRALHRPAPADAPSNPHRGVPLADRGELLHARVAQLGAEIDRPAVVALWERLVRAPAWSGAPVWLHGDLHPANVLVDRGRVSAVIDFGDITAGDPATDLAIAWMLLPRDARAGLRAAAGDVDDATWARARGWALALAVAILSSSADNPVMHGVGRRTLEAVLREDA